ncbi:MAG: hypothetical protein QM756_33500 [Polyangiaceae bacterium]
MGRMCFWAVGLLASLSGCSGPCSDVADQLRKCCARGPAELRSICEAEAQRIEDDGDADTCRAALGNHNYEGCEP